MARLLTTGAELAEVIEHNGAVGSLSPTFTPEVSTTHVRTGSYAFYFDSENNGQDRWFSHNVGTPQEVFIRTAFMYREVLATTPTPLCFISAWEGSNCHFALGLSLEDSLLRLYQGGSNDMGDDGSVIATGTTPLRMGQWYLIEVRLYVDNNPNGIITVKVNNVTDIGFTGDAQQGANAYVTYLRFGSNNFGAGVGAVSYQDDIAVNDTTGTQQNSWVGGGGVYLLKPDGAGNSADWTSSSGGANYTTVDEIPANDSDWNYSSTSTDKDTFTLEDLPAEITSINLVEALFQAALAEAGAQTMKTVIRHSAVDYSGETENITAVITDWQLEKGAPVYEVLGSSGAWSPSQVNALEAGYEIP